MKMLSSMETMESSQSDVINGALPCTQRASNHEGPISAQALTCYEVHYSHEFLQSLRRSCCCEAVVLQAQCCKSRCCRHGVLKNAIGEPAYTPSKPYFPRWVSKLLLPLLCHRHNDNHHAPLLLHVVHLFHLTKLPPAASRGEVRGVRPTGTS